MTKNENGKFDTYLQFIQIKLVTKNHHSDGNCMDGVIVSLLALSAVDGGLKPWSGQNIDDHFVSIYEN